MESLDVGALISDAIKRAYEERGHANVLIAGRTGVGKSTLVNSVFQGSYATTGHGRPVTKNTREYTKDDVPLTIFDTRGLEMADFSATLTELRSFVADRGGDRDKKRHIHVAWVCIAEDLRRVEQAEIDLTRMLADSIPVIGVITKARADQGFRAEVQRLLPSTKNVVRVRAIPEQLDDGHTLQPMGLVELVQLTVSLLPDGHQRAFVAAQKADLALKKKKSHVIVASSAAGAAVCGAAPIPFSDAVAIVPIQIAMIAGITATYGLGFSDGFLYALVASTIGSASATLTGRAIVGGLLKFIPGVGTVAGGLISASTAAALTTGFGELYIAVLDALFSKHQGEPPTQQEVLDEMKRRLEAR